MAGASLNSSVYVWYKQNTGGGSSPFPVDVCHYLEGNYNKTQRIDLQNIPDSAKDRHPYLTEYVVDTTTFQQEHKRSGNKEHLKRQKVIINTVNDDACNGEWLWDTGSDFVLYDINAILVIERSYCQYQQNSHSRHSHVDLSKTSAKIAYTIHFTQDHDGCMFQTSNVFRTRRQVMRFSLPMPLQWYLGIPYKGPPPAVMTTSAVPQPSKKTARSALATKSALPLSTYTSSSSSPVSLWSGSTSPSPNSMSQPHAIPSTVASTSTSSQAKYSSGSLMHGSTSSSSSSTRASGTRTSGTRTRSTVDRGEVDLTGGPDPAPSNGVRCCSAPLPPDVAKYVSRVRGLTDDQDGPCPVCLCQLSEDSDYEKGQGLDVVQMSKCPHMLHRQCFLQYLKSSGSSDVGIRCPTCKKIHGVKMGDMPISFGHMVVAKRPGALPGHPGCGIIEIAYHFRSGRDQAGQPFTAYSFPRTCYLPDSAKGNKVLKLLQVAWERRLTFTIGTSVTTGASNAVVWNEIHHKTECHGNSSGHGYPDPNYLDNVLMELKSQGVTEDSMT